MYNIKLNPYFEKYNDPAFCRRIFPPIDTLAELLRTKIPKTAAILPCCHHIMISNFPISLKAINDEAVHCTPYIYII